MKKILLLLIIVFILCGCEETNTSNAQLSDEIQKTFYVLDGKNFTTNDIFQNLKSQQASFLAENEIAKFVLNNNNYNFDSKRNELEEQYEMIIQMYGGEESFLSMSGYKSKEDYIEAVLQNSYTSIYLKYYVENHINKYDSKYNAKYIEYVSSSNKKLINSFQKKIKKKVSFEKAFEKVKFKDDESITKEIFSNDISTLPNEVKEAINKLTPEDIKSDVIEVETTPEATEEDPEPETTITYYVIHILSDTPSIDYKDEYIDFIINNEKLTSIVQVFDEEHTIEFYDEDFEYVYNNLIKEHTEQEIEEDNTVISE